MINNHYDNVFTNGFLVQSRGKKPDAFRGFRKIENNEFSSVNLKDFNNDGKTDYTDLFFFSDGWDMDNDGNISDEEKAFINAEKQKYIEKNPDLTYTEHTSDNATIENVYENGKKVKTTETTADGSVTVREFDDDEKIISEITTAPDGSVTTGKFANGVITESETICADGRVIKAFYNENGVITSRVEKNNTATTTYTYANGMITSAVKNNSDGSKVTYSYVSGLLFNAEKVTYNKNNKIASKMQYEYDAAGNEKVYSKLVYTYNSSKNIDYTQLYFYDSNGKAYLAGKDKYNYNGQQGDLSSIKTIAYDKNGNVIATVSNGYSNNREAHPLPQVTPDGIIIAFNDNKYIKLNKGDSVRISVHQAYVTRADGSVTQYNADGKIKFYKNTNGQKATAPKSVKPLCSTPTTLKASTSENITDENGIVIRQIGKDEKGNTIFETELIRDDNGYVTKQIRRDTKGNILQETENIRDDKGNVTKQIIKDAKGNLISETEFTYENGKRINAVKTEYNGSKITKKTAYAYHENGKTAKAIIIDYVQGLTKTNIYNEQGKATYSEIRNSHGERKTTTNYYDETGLIRLTATVNHFMADGKKRATCNYKYKSNGLVASNSRVIYHIVTGKIYIRCTYKRNSDGTVKSETMKFYTADGKTYIRTGVVTNAWA